MTNFSSLASVYAQLTSFANLSNFWSLFNTAFGSSYDSVKATSFRSQWQTGNFSLFPQIEVVSSDVLGTANGAYGISTNKIYLSDSFISLASQQALVDVLLEEFGHFVDAQVNKVDSAGDEGAIFAALVQEESVDALTLQALKAEDDHGTIVLNGQIIQVEQANITGTSGNDSLNGTSSDDTINGLAGNDTLSGNSGNDYIIGGEGNDSINGGAGDDYLSGDNDGSEVSGSVDTLIGGDGNDYLYGGAGNDYLDGGLGSNRLYGGSGVDVFVISAGNDTIIGGQGNENINGGAGDDYLFGDNDYSEVAGSVDTLIGGDGNDYLSGGAGNDYLDGGLGGNLLDGGSGDDVFAISAGNDQIIGGQGNESINGGAGNDYLFGDNNYSEVAGGVDTLIGGDNDDHLYGGAGNDSLNGVDPTKSNPGKGENDDLEGGTGADIFILGDSTWIGYDNNQNNDSTGSDCARIADFNVGDGDKIQLQGSSSNYLLVVDGSDTQIFINKPSTEFYDELIGIVRNQTGLVLTGSYFVYKPQTTQPTITLAVAPASVLEDGTPNLVYTFTRTGATTNALTVNYGITGTANATDYTGATPGAGKTITFAAGSVTAAFTVNPTADTTVEANETVALTLATGTGYTVGTTTVTGTITNDDTAAVPGISLGLNYSGISENSPSNFIYTFTRTGATTNALTVKYNLAGTALSTDYTGAIPGTGKTITFAVGSGTAILTLDSTADTTVETDETISLQLTTGTGYSVGTTNPQIATIINDDGTRRHKGTTGKDVLLGTTATDYLIGGAGDDNLTGGAGGDLFSFATADLGNDRITDFAPGQDAIVVSAQGFGGGLIAGDTITTAQFLLGSTATNASQRFIYNSSNGALLFDIDGNGSQTAKQIATLNTGLAPTFEDIFVS
jgi:Ca2+-binding RTX toxin-like protein